MSQAETLLNELEDVIVPEGYIIIGSDRRITVPDTLKRVAVQYDHNVETVTFECPKHWDGHDLSTMDIYINYLRADGKPGSFKAENVKAEEDSPVMHFDWVIQRHLTEVKGGITFLVCMSEKDENGVETIHWNTELCRDMSISEGLETNELIPEVYPDIITELLLGFRAAVQVPITEYDEGKFMRVVGGQWAAVAMSYAEEASF